MSCATDADPTSDAPDKANTPPKRPARRPRKPRREQAFDAWAIPPQPPAPPIDTEALSLLDPDTAWRRGLTRHFGIQRLVEPLHVEPAANPADTPVIVRRRGNAAGATPLTPTMPAGTPPATETAATSPGGATSPPPPLTPEIECIADFIALHGRVDADEIATAFRLKPIDVAAILATLQAHGMLLSDAGNLRPAPDLTIDGGGGVFNTFLHPPIILKGRKSQQHSTEWPPDRVQWAAIAIRIAQSCRGHFEAATSSLAWKRNGRLMIHADFLATQVNLKLVGTRAMARRSELEQIPGVQKVRDAQENLGTKKSPNMTVCVTAVVGSTFDAAALESLLLDVLNG